MRHPLLHHGRTWITLWVIWAFALVPALSLNRIGPSVNGTGPSTSADTCVSVVGSTVPTPTSVEHHAFCPLCLLQAGGGIGAYLLSDISHVWPELGPLRIWCLSTTIARSGSPVPERPGSPRGPPVWG